MEMCNNKCAMWVMVIGFALAVGAKAALIDPANLTATSSTSHGTYPDPMVVVNGSGLTSATEHTSNGGSWFTAAVDPDRWIIVDLDGTYNIGEVKVWNANERWGWNSIGFNETEFYVANMAAPGNPVDNRDNWTLVTTVVLTAAPGADGYDTPDVVALGGALATHVALRSLTATGAYGDDRAGLSEIQVYSGAAPPPPILAFDPDPADEATDVLRDAVLSWTPGVFAPAVNGHIVYLSENFNDVNDGIGGITQSADSHAPAQRLEFETTYYWRVDEVNAPPDSTVYPGEVWSFTTESFSYPINGANITATASSVFETSGPEKTIDGSGLNASDLHSTNLEDMWLSGTLGPQPTWIEYQFDKAYRLHEMWVWNQNQPLESVVGYGFKDVLVEHSVDGIAYTTLGTTHEFAQAPAPAGNYAHNTTIDLGGAMAKYVRLTANNNWGGIVSQSGLSEVRFFQIPVSAREPSPNSGATGVDVDTVLGWRAGREAASHDVYFSTDEQTVIDGTAPVTTVANASYAPLLDLGSTYFWRTDEVNDAETPTTWQGDVWDFTTEEFIAVENFESYNDIESGQTGSMLVYETWVDGFGVPANGSTMGYSVAFEPTMETDTVHGGRQSAPMEYNNVGASFSEVTRTLAAQNWTEHGVQTLSLWFYGDPANVPGQLYVKINGVQVTYDGDAGNLAREVWQVWNIDLTSVGTDLQSVTSLTIGVEGIGATGTLLLDDIRLYAFGRELITPVQPDPASLVGHWKFDEGSGTTAQDSSGNGHAGNLNGSMQWAAGTSGTALRFDGDDWVDCGDILTITDALTIACWVNPTALNGDNSWVTREGAYVFKSSGTSLLFTTPGEKDHMADDTTLQIGEWQHVAVTFVPSQPGGAIFYLNGFEAQRIDSSVLNAGTGPFRIGNNQWDQVYEGLIDDVRVHDRTLSLAEVASLAGRTHPFDKPF